MALTAAVASFAALPRPTFTATAVVGAEGGRSMLRPAMIQAALDAAMSRPVMDRAASGLAASGAGGRSASPAAAVARLGATLPSAVRAEAGPVRGSLLIRASDPDAERAAAMASAVATALVAELDDREAVARRQGEAADARRLGVLREQAEAAHRRLAVLGDDGLVSAAGHDAATRADTLRARLDAIRAILASGAPPLGAGRDVPPAIEALQASYLDLTRQLAKASETLGDRHTTVIALRDGVKRTAADLGAAWARLEKTTETELADAKRSASSGTAADAGHTATIEAARLAARSADEALTRAQAPSDDEAAVHFRLVASAPAPATADGLALPARLAIGATSGLAGLAAAYAARRRRRLPQLVGEEPLVAVAAPIEPSFFEDESVAASFAEDPPGAELPHETVPEPEGVATIESDEETLEMDHFEAAVPTRTPNADLTAALAGVLPAIERIAARAEVPVVLMATNEAGLCTMDAGLALAEAAAVAGRRVLVVEGDKARPALAAAVEVEAEPAVVDVLGQPRVVLRAEVGDGFIYLAPSFRDGARLAADLVATGDILVADALADEFDLVIIDGDRAAGARETAGDADLVLRVGRFASARDDEHFLSTLGWSREGFLGTIIAAAAVFVPCRVETPKLAAALVTRPQPMPRPNSARQSWAVAPRRSMPGDTRRRVGLR